MEETLEDLLDYTYRHPLISFFHAWGHRQAERFLARESALVLDLGCGRGDHLRYSQTRRKYVGLDLSWPRLRYAASHFDYLALVAACALRLPFKDESFNAVISIYNLEHIKEIEISLQEVRRILKSEGSFIVLLPTESLFFQIGRNLSTKKYAENKYGIDYLKLVKEEHINSVTMLVSLLRKYFSVDLKRYHPFPALFNFANISLALKMRKGNKIG